MQTLDIVRMAFSGLQTHRTRSALTILGIVIGITSITLVMSFGQSAENLILGEVQGLGSTQVFIVPGKQPTGPTEAGGTLLEDSLTNKDIEDLQKKSNVPDAVRVGVFVFTPVTAAYESETFRGMLLGGNEPLAGIHNLNVSAGAFFTQEDVSQKSDSVVLGKKAAEKLFGFNNPIGEKIKIRNRNYRVIGILETKGQSSFMNFDDAMLAPYTTVQEYVMGIKYVMRAAVEASSMDTVSSVVKDIETTLRANHNISDPEDDDFFVQTQADIAKSIGTVMIVLTVLLSSVAAISLIVGGVGIMNIMLVSVTERTREIGLRKALGAANRDILMQFLFEAVILTLSGGIVGIVLGVLFSYFGILAARRFTDVMFELSFPITGIMVGIAVSVTTGLIFGIFPARQASKKSPIEALRYE